MALTTIYLDTLENIPIEVLSEQEEDKTTEANHYINLLFEKTKLAKLKDDMVSEIKIEIKTVINAKLDKIKLTRHQDDSNTEHELKKTTRLIEAGFFGK